MQNNSPEEELKEVIERFEEMKQEGKFLYLDAEQYIDIAEWYAQNERKADAYDLLEKAFDIHPENSSLVVMYTVILIDDNRLEEAREMLNKVLSEGSMIDVQLANIELLAAENKVEEAEREMDALPLDILTDVECEDLANICTNLGLLERALYWSEKAFELNPNNEIALQIVAESHYGLGHIEETIEKYNTLLDINPYSAEYWVAISRPYFCKGNIDKAIEACDFAIVADENFGNAYYIKGHILFHIENYESAIEAYLKALELGAFVDENGPLLISHCYIGIEDWEKAYEYAILGKILVSSFSEEGVSCYMNAALGLRMMGKYEEAQSQLDRIIEKIPDHLEAHIKKGHYYLEEEKVKDAIHCFQQAISISPTADTWNSIGDIALECKEYEIAKYIFSHLKEVEPKYKGVNKKLNYISDMENEEDVLTGLNRNVLEYYMEMINNVVGGEQPKRYDIDSFISKAAKDGHAPEDLLKMKEALIRINEIVDYFESEEEEVK